ncbi:M28 family peptidase [Metabacillus sp. FJAT-52054]|uniref:Carboxypeptidase Q n=1 Tax=Metabacillus sediminis TaxID=3117746 RepID=A0ABZ2NIR8_9BACI
MKSNKYMKLVLAAVIALPFAGQTAHAEEKNAAQEQAEKTAMNAFMNKVDQEYAFSKAYELSKYKWRTAGSQAEHQASLYVEKEMRKLGLQDVKKESFEVDSWEFKGGNLTFKDYPRISMPVASYATKGTPKSGLKADLIYVGKGTQDDYKNIDAKGKIVLLDIDLKNDWWINYPALQAELQGAAGVIAIVRDTYGTISRDTLNTFDFTGPVTIPTVNISVKDGSKLKNLLKKKKSLSVNLKTDNKVTPKGTSYNVVGKIPGKTNTGGIIVGGHLDGYFEGFNDNAASIGLMLGVAKAMKDSNYKPEHPIYFVGHAAEEYGAINSYFDWQIGSWNMINKLHPEWRGNSRLFVNTEFAAIKLKDSDEVNTNDELMGFVQDYIDSKAPAVNTATYPNGYKVTGNNSTGSDDYSYSIAGVPTVANDRSGSDFFTTLYHTQYDTARYGNKEVLADHVKLYGSLMIHADQIAIMPFDFGKKLEGFQQTIDDDILKSADIDPATLRTETGEAKKLADSLYKKMLDINEKQREAATSPQQKAALAKAEKELLQVFQLTQGELMKLNWSIAPTFAHKEHQKTISLLDQSIAALQQGKGQEALDEYLLSIEDEWYSYHFDKKVIDQVTDSALHQPDDRLFWGAGKYVKNVDLYNVISSVKENTNGDYTKEIAELKKVKAEQEAELSKAVKEETELMRKIRMKLENVKL